MERIFELLFGSWKIELRGNSQTEQFQHSSVCSLTRTIERSALILAVSMLSNSISFNNFLQPTIEHMPTVGSPLERNFERSFE